MPLLKMESIIKNKLLFLFPQIMKKNINVVLELSFGKRKDILVIIW